MFRIILLIFCCSVCLLSCQNEEQKTPAQPTEKSNPIITYPEGLPKVSIEEVTGKFDPATHEKFVIIDEQYADRAGMYIRVETYEAFKKMYVAANADDVKLIIRSATRNFDRQKQIWEAKWTGKRLVENGENLAETTKDPKARALKILQWSSMPGSSRHHWGTDIDLNSFENSYFAKGKGKKEYDWLTAHAANYGFCQPYSKKGDARPNGYNEEKWHWSYMPVAGDFYGVAHDYLSNEHFQGFLGSETAAAIDVKQNFVLSVSPTCQSDGGG